MHASHHALSHRQYRFKLTVPPLSAVSGRAYPVLHHLQSMTPHRHRVDVHIVWTLHSITSTMTVHGGWLVRTAPPPCQPPGHGLCALQRVPRWLSAGLRCRARACARHAQSAAMHAASQCSATAAKPRAAAGLVGGLAPWLGILPCAQVHRPWHDRGRGAPIPQPCTLALPLRHTLSPDGGMHRNDMQIRRNDM